MVNWYTWTTFDLIGDLAFGEPFHCLDESVTHPWIAITFGNHKSIVFVELFRRYGLFSLVQLLLPKRITEARLQNYQYSKDKITRRMALGKDRGDFMDHVLKHEYPKGMTAEELTSTGSTLVVAGSETTATLLSGATYLLLRHPKALHRLVTDVRHTFTNDEDITISSVCQMKYLDAVLEETFRIYPPIAIGTLRTVPFPGDIVLGKWLPGGVRLPVLRSEKHTYHF